MLESRINTTGKKSEFGEDEKNIILSFKKGKTDNKEKFVYAKETDTLEDKPSEKH